MKLLPPPSSHNHWPDTISQWHLWGIKAAWLYIIFSPWNFLCPHFPKSCESSFPHLLQFKASWEVSSFILSNEFHEGGRLSDFPLKYWTTASPELLAAVITWNVRPFRLLQWNRNWVNNKCVLSSFMALFVIPISLLAKLLIPRYDDSAVQSFDGNELFILKLATRSQPPEIRNIRVKFCSHLFFMRLQHSFHL